MPIESTPDFVEKVYKTTADKIAIIRQRLGRPLTLAEKILYGHLDDPNNQEIIPGKSYILVNPDRVCMQDATAQMALLQFMLAGRKTVAVPTTVHCDHLILAKMGADEDLKQAYLQNNEVYKFLRSASQKYGIGFWEPGAGIIHQVVLENYAFPGGMMIGTDSHTPNGGGLGMFASGVGGSDAADVMSGLPWEVLNPEVIGVHLTGRMSGWTSSKDVILYLCGVLTTDGGTNKVIEYFGPGAKEISATGKGTITNMGAELGATTSMFPYDECMARYLRATKRGALADIADKHKDLLTADPEVEKNPERFFKRVVEIDLSKLEPHIVGPHTPDLARPISKMAEDVKMNDYPDNLSSALIGSCTNSSYEDISRAADIAEQARAHGMKINIPFLITPGSEQIRATIERDGQIATLRSINGKVLANACGPCIGQWERTDGANTKKNSILTSFNRNFPKRNDGSPNTLSFMSSPEIVIAYALAGKLSFNPMTDSLKGADGKEFKLHAPKDAAELPSRGFDPGKSSYTAPSADSDSIKVEVSPTSLRLALLEPFTAWDGKDFLEMPVLLKAKGKCTTDHISPAGPWLTYRGHLDKISDNMFLGAINAFTEDAGKGLNELSSAKGEAFPKIARDYKSRGLRWVAIGDVNYGEGSSREHAAMSPRYLGAAAIITRSFARIHESNLKKQGMLPLTFVDPADYDKVQETDRVSITGLASLAPGKNLSATLHHADGRKETIALKHTMNIEQVGWFKSGSALNYLKKKAA
ncbi:MAG: aconitate hydratase [Dehalococcoidia bacterium]|nr:aconitate hydratase [Dehalococcoidia bacterium]